MIISSIVYDSGCSMLCAHNAWDGFGTCIRIMHWNFEIKFQEFAQFPPPEEQQMSQTGTDTASKGSKKGVAEGMRSLIAL